MEGEGGYKGPPSWMGYIEDIRLADLVMRKHGTSPAPTFV
jgi:hypothetical protein